MRNAVWVGYAQAVTCPALFMHGDGDPRVRVDEGRRVFDAVPGPKQFKAFPAVGHESYAARFPAEWRATVEAFMGTLDQHAQVVAKQGP